jgi:hypothetical protein
MKVYRKKVSLAPISSHRAVIEPRARWGIGENVSREIESREIREGGGGRRRSERARRRQRRLSRIRLDPVSDDR